MRPWMVAMVMLAVPATAVAGGETVPFQLDGNEIVVPVMLEGQGPFRFVLDTGAARSAVSMRVTRQVSPGPMGHTIVVTPSGRSRRLVTRIERFVLGPWAPVTIFPIVIPEVQTRSAAVDGLIGQDVLARLTYTIDYARRALIRHTGYEPEGSSVRLPLQCDEGRVLVSLEQSGAAPLQFIPDSGAAAIVLFARAGRARPHVAPLNPILLRTLDGQRVVRRVLVEGLTVGSVRLGDQPATIVDAADARLGDGLLPLHLFARVTISGPGKYLIVEPK